MNILYAHRLHLLLWKYRKSLLKFAFFGLLFGLFLSLCLPKEYEARTKTVAESIALPGDEEWGGLAEENALGSPTGYEALKPSLYPQIFMSFAFLDSFLNIPVQTIDCLPDSTLALREYMEHHQRRLFPLSPDELVDALRERMDILPDKKTRTMVLACRMQDPLVAATVLDSLNRRIHAYITEYRTRRSREELSAATKVLAQAKERLYSAQEAQAAFEDRNRDLFTGNAKTEQTRLRVQTALAKEEYERAVLKEQAARAKVVRVRPVFAVIEPPTVPVRPASPSKLKYMLAFGLAGLAAGYVRAVLGMRRKEFTR